MHHEMEKSRVLGDEDSPLILKKRITTNRIESSKEALCFTLLEFSKYVILDRVVPQEFSVNQAKPHLGQGYQSYKTFYNPILDPSKMFHILT